MHVSRRRGSRRRRQPGSGCRGRCGGRRACSCPEADQRALTFSGHLADGAVAMPATRHRPSALMASGAASTIGRMGRRFGWLWVAYAVSTFGTWLAFDAFPLIAILVLDAGPAAVSLLAATGLAAGAAVAVPLGPWVEFRRKRPVMIASDLVRFAAVASVPAAYALGALTFAQLLVVSVVVAASDIAFRAASGAYLKALRVD